METIKVSNGYVQGQRKTILGKDIVEFLSIPYCRAPINDLRFKKPQVATFVDGVINHSEFKTCPPQKFIKIFENNEDEQSWIPTEEQSEDCLYLNIWCPYNKLKKNEERYSVFVWIYGGGFVSGSSSLSIYNGSVLAAQQNIIVISFNYRIGLLGFLCLDDEINGNQGIWDQLMALKWIYENIANFHGNPCNITLGGNSAGACSVTLHLIIEESWDYYSKIVVQSGVCLSDWAFLPKEEIVGRSEKMVNYLLEKSDASLRWNISLEKSEKENILKILQDMDFHQFLNEPYLEGFCNFGWTPCVDGSLIKVNPETLFRSKKFKNCPSIFLNVENEGTYFLLFEFSDFVVDSNCVDEKYFNECFKYYPSYPTLSPSALQAKIIDEYNLNLSQMSIHTLDKIISDRHFVCDSIRLANYVSEKSDKTYYLWFNTYATKKEWPEWVGIMHSDEIYYLFGYNIFQNDETFDKCSIKYMDNIGHFIKHGSLPHGLPVYENGTKNYILIENDQWNVVTFSEDQMRKVKFWEELRLQTN